MIRTRHFYAGETAFRLGKTIYDFPRILDKREAGEWREGWRFAKGVDEAAAAAPVSHRVPMEPVPEPPLFDMFPSDHVPGPTLIRSLEEPEPEFSEPPVKTRRRTAEGRPVKAAQDRAENPVPANPQPQNPPSKEIHMAMGRPRLSAAEKARRKEEKKAARLARGAAPARRGRRPNAAAYNPGGGDLLERAREQLQAQEAEVVKTRRFINAALEFMGEEPEFDLED